MAAALVVAVAVRAPQHTAGLAEINRGCHSVRPFVFPYVSYHSESSSVADRGMGCVG